MGRVAVGFLAMSRPECLTIENVSLYASDICLLQDGQWLNDAVLSFGMQLLHRSAPEAVQEKVYCVDPAATMLLVFATGMCGGL